MVGGDGSADADVLDRSVAQLVYAAFAPVRHDQVLLKDHWYVAAFGLILLRLSVILKTSIMWTIGIIMLLVGAVLLLLNTVPFGPKGWSEGSCTTMLTEIPRVTRHPSGCGRAGPSAALANARALPDGTLGQSSQC